MKKPRKYAATYADDGEMRLALLGPAIFSAVHEHLENFLRGALKYGHAYKTPDEALEACRDNLLENLPKGFWDVE